MLLSLTRQKGGKMPRQKTIKLYTKVCAKCIWSDKFNELESYAQKKGAILKVKRTAYRPDWHKKAVELYGSEDYVAFIYEGGRVKDFPSWATHIKAKPVKKTKAKRTKKKAKKNDVQGLSQAKGDNREDSLAVEANKNKEKDEVNNG